LLAIAEELANRDLDWFFELYLRQPELPELKVHVSGGQCTLRWKTPGDMAFPMPVEVLVGGELRRVEMAEGEGVLALPPGTTHEVDPHSRVLMKRHRW